MGKTKEHQYAVTVEWCGNKGTGTSAYRDYGREHTISCDPKPPIPGSSDPAFRGNPERWNPEDLLVAAASACHKLWYLHLCSEAGVTVTAYTDHAVGYMIEDAVNGDRMTGVTLRPHVTIKEADKVFLAIQIHDEVPPRCAIANSIKCAIHHEPIVVTAPD